MGSAGCSRRAVALRVREMLKMLGKLVVFWQDFRFFLKKVDFCLWGLRFFITLPHEDVGGSSKSRHSPQRTSSFD